MEKKEDQPHAPALTHEKILFEGRKTGGAPQFRAINPAHREESVIERSGGMNSIQRSKVCDRSISALTRAFTLLSGFVVCRVGSLKLQLLGKSEPRVVHQLAASSWDSKRLVYRQCRASLSGHRPQHRAKVDGPPVSTPRRFNAADWARPDRPLISSGGLMFIYIKLRISVI
jgi:hypothetical protein